MRQSGATAVATMRRRESASAASSTLRLSRIHRNPLKTNDGGTLYPSQNRKILFARERRNLRSRSSSPESTCRGFRSRKELECTHQLQSQTWKSEGGFSWQFISL